MSEGFRISGEGHYAASQFCRCVKFGNGVDVVTAGIPFCDRRRTLIATTECEAIFRPALKYSLAKRLRSFPCSSRYGCLAAAFDENDRVHALAGNHTNQRLFFQLRTPGNTARGRSAGDEAIRETSTRAAISPWHGTAESQAT